MGSKSRQQSTESPSPATAAPAEAASATPEQDTLGNAAVAERVGKSSMEVEPSMLLDAEGELDFGGFTRELQITGMSASFFADGALQVEQIRMLNAATPSQVVDLLAGISTHAAKRLFARVAPDQRLKIASAWHAIVPVLDLDLTVEFMFSQGTAPLASYLTSKQMNALTNAESGAHPKLARLMSDVSGGSGGIGALFDEAFGTMPTYESVLFVLALERSSPDALRYAITAWGPKEIAQHLDAAERYEPDQFDALEAMFNRFGYGSYVEIWYTAKAAK